MLQFIEGKFTQDHNATVGVEYQVVKVNRKNI
jgi:hypothetical protein